MHILSVSLLLFSFIHHGDMAKVATAVLYQANTNTTAGTLMISQNDSTVSVTVMGVIFGLNSSSVHVCPLKVEEFSD